MHEDQSKGLMFDNKMILSDAVHSTSTSVENGASWTYVETRILLALWAQNCVQKQLSRGKRTRLVWEKIAERIRQHGYQRTPDQVKTRIFNMIAEYRRIMKHPTTERIKKFIFFDALHQIYRAKNSNTLESVMICHGDENYNFDPIDFSNDDDGVDTTDSDFDEINELLTLSPTLSQNLNDFNDYFNRDGDILPQVKRNLLETNHLEGHLPSGSTLDNSASTLLIDRMFAHLSKETEVMREWVKLERERLAQEVVRRREDKEREERREKSFMEIVSKLQEQIVTLSKTHINGNSAQQSSHSC